MLKAGEQAMYEMYVRELCSLESPLEVLLRYLDCTLGMDVQSNYYESLLIANISS
jgi:hypothetical protein